MTTRSALRRACVVAAGLLAQILWTGCASGPRYMGRRLGEWAEQLSDRGEGTRNAAGIALYSAGEEGLPYLLEARKSRDIFVRIAVVDTFHEFFKVADPAQEAQALEVLLAALQDPDLRVRRRALRHVIELESTRAGWLAENGDPANAEDAASEALVRSTAAALIEALSDSDPQIRTEAAEGLGQLRKYAAAAVSPLSVLRESKDETVRLDSSIALIGIGTEEAVVAVGVDDLVGLLGSERVSDGEKRDAAKGLGRLGVRARAAIPALEKAAESSDMWLSQAAKEALQQIRGE